MEALAAPKVKAPKYLSIYNKESRKSAETSCQLGFPLGVGFVLEKLGSEFVALSFEVSGEGNLGGEVARARDAVIVASSLKIGIDDRFLYFFGMLHVGEYLVEIPRPPLGAQCFVELLVLGHIVLSSLNSAHVN